MDEKKPILYCIFNRLDVVKKSFESIKKAKPSRLYIAADGPRVSKPEEGKKVEEVISYVENNIDWECEINRNYSETNLGCRERISSAITWALSLEEDIIIIEDDIVPSQDFYIFCSEMLDYYKDDEKVMMISGSNFVKKYTDDKPPYFFSSFPSVWVGQPGREHGKNLIILCQIGQK